MKKLLIIAGTITFILVSIFVINSSIDAEQVNTTQTSGYAIIKDNNCYFYRTTNTKSRFSDRFFLLEKSYFVKILENTNDDYYKAEYNGIVGYVQKKDIDFVEEVPLMPYLEDITFDIYSGSSVCLRTEPTTQNGIGTIITTLPANKKNLSYYGKITGEESINGLGNIWYYCSYKTSENKEIFGYIYSPQTLNLSPITENNESVTTVSIKDYAPIYSLLYLNLSTKNLIILALALPSLFVIYLFVKPTKILKK